ncbi:MAG: hypothetical protein FWC62_04920 [Firmicutes bacterium]|nr:hypothetical protein [Bacillota bacterium]
MSNMEKTLQLISTTNAVEEFDPTSLGDRVFDEDCEQVVKIAVAMQLPKFRWPEK